MENSSSPTRLLWVGAVLVVALFAGLLAKNRLMFQPHTEALQVETCNLDVNKPCALSPKAAAMFSEENRLRYIYPKGEGFTLTLAKVINGKTHSRPFELKGWQTYQEERDNSARAEFVKDKEAEFAKLLAWWTNRDPDNLKIMVVVDVTGAIEQSDIALIGNNVGYRRIVESVSAGDSLELTTCIVSDDPRAPCERLIVKQGESSRAQEVQARLQALYAKHPEVPNTALVERLRSIIAELTRANTMPEEIIVFSDGMQFNSDIDFYRTQHGLLMDEKKWGELKKLIEPGDRTLGDLKGVRFTWFKPGRRMTPAESATVDKAIAFWTSLLRDHGAFVEVILE